MGLYSLLLLFLGIVFIGALYARTGGNRVSHHVAYALLLLLFLVGFFSVHHHFQKTCGILIGGNVEQITSLIRSWGIAAPLMSILLMVTQAIVAPLPAVLVTAANGMVFGGFWGAVISWTGALAGALTSFYIARLVGGQALKKVGRNQKTLDFIRRAGEKKGGFYAILLARLVPFVSFDIISYLAGLSSIRPWVFTLATALGMLPATVLYSSLGGEIPVMGETSPLLLTGTVVFVFVLVALAIAQGLRKKA